MITQSVSKRYQRGGSLIELMISSLIGLVLLGVIGSVFISLQKTAREKKFRITSSTRTQRYPHVDERGYSASGLRWW